MHINYRRGEDRVFVGLHDGGSCSFEFRGRRSSFQWQKRQSWSKRRMAEREAVYHEREMPRWRRHIRWDWL